MRGTARASAFLLAATALAACGGSRNTLGLIFLNGRAVEPVGDSLLAMTAEGVNGVIVYDLRTSTADTLGREALTAPFHIQALDGRWYVSDLVNGHPHVVILAHDGSLLRDHDLASITSTPHQFAVLPNGRIIVESTDSRLLAVHDDSVTTFALVDIGNRPSLIAGVAGGVLHAVPQKHLTLYNEFGHIRWRITWPWAETAYFVDIAQDRNGRIHMMAGVPSDSTFIVYTLGRDDGAVLQWSRPGPYATFTVEWNGNLWPDSVEAWLGGGGSRE
jgi:hypothetical protein